MKMSKKLKLTDNTYHPVKIAVLDTGLESHPRFNKVNYRDFVNSEDDGQVNTSLHGTQSVDLILRAYPEAELYVGRAFENDSDSTEPAHLAEVGE
jgi:hypothetical protein